MTNAKERRLCSRVLLELKAAFRTDNETVVGRVRNISLTGMFLECGERPAVGTRGAIELILFGDSSEMTVRLSGDVVRHDDEGLGIQFHVEGIELDSFMALKNAIVANSADSKRIVQEYMRFLAANNSDPGGSDP
jgi:hypothetical protein